MNIIGIGGLTLAVNTWGTAIFDLGTMPEAFRTLTNITSDVCSQICYQNHTTFTTP